MIVKGSRESSRTSNSDKAGYSVVMPEDIGEGLVKVGKIIFDTGQVLGKGCDGTFVYRYVYKNASNIYLFFIQNAVFFSMFF